MKGVTVRPAGIEDCETVATLVRDYDAERGRESDPLSTRGAAMACVDLPEHDLLVAELNGEVVGYIAVHWVPFPMIHGCEGYVSDLLVRSDRRGSGIGTKLIDAVAKSAKDSGGARLMLNARQAADPRLQRFYEKAGFEPRAEFGNFVRAIG